MSQDDLLLLSRVSFLKDADPALLQIVAERCTRKTYKAGKVLFKEGAEGSGLGIVMEGQISIDRFLGNGKVLHLAVRGPGDVIGEMSVLDGLPRSATATAVKDAVVLTLRREDFNFCFRRSMDLMMHVMTSLSKRLREVSDLMAGLNLKNVDQRLASQLLKMVEEGDEADYIRLDVPQHELAHRCWCTREHINRALGRLRKDGVLKRVKGQLYQVDVEALEDKSMPGS